MMKTTWASLPFRRPVFRRIVLDFASATDLWRPRRRLLLLLLRVPRPVVKINDPPLPCGLTDGVPTKKWRVYWTLATDRRGGCPTTAMHAPRTRLVQLHMDFKVGGFNKNAKWRLVSESASWISGWSLLTSCLFHAVSFSCRNTILPAWLKFLACLYEIIIYSNELSRAYN